MQVLLSLDPWTRKNWPRYQELLPPEELSGLIESDDRDDRWLVVNLMQALYFYGSHEQAADLAGRARTTWSERLGANDCQALMAASYQGLFLWELGRYAEAAELSQRTLKRSLRVFGDGSVEVITAQLRAAADTRTRGDFVMAKELGADRGSIQWQSSVHNIRTRC